MSAHLKFCRGVSFDSKLRTTSPVSPEDCRYCKAHWECQTHHRPGPHPAKRFPTVHGGVVNCLVAALKPVQACVCPCAVCAAARKPVAKSA